MDPTEQRYCYIFVRQDLPPTVQIVQSCHAVAHATAWFQGVESANFVLVHVAGTNALGVVAATLDSLNIDFKFFFEPDLKSHTAICTAPIRKSDKGALKKYSIATATATATATEGA